MDKHFLFAGASSAMAIAGAHMLRSAGNRVSGISRSPVENVYDEIHLIEEYTFGKFPKTDEAIDGLVYFPGSIRLKPFSRMTETDFLEDFRINALGAAAFIQTYLSNLKRSSSPSIVLISSVAAQTGLPFHSSIAMAKGAVESLVRSLAAELAPSIRVNAIAPSLTDTPLAEKLLSSAEKTEASRKRNPMQKIGHTEDMASAIEFLLSEKSEWISGQILAIDGGMGKLKVG